jgi:hypothetical protein
MLHRKKRGSREGCLSLTVFVAYTPTGSATFTFTGVNQL